MTFRVVKEKRVPSSRSFPDTNGTLAILPARSCRWGGWAKKVPSALGSQGEFVCHHHHSSQYQLQLPRRRAPQSRGWNLGRTK